LLIFFFRRIVQIITSVFARDERQRQTARWIIFYIIIGSIPIAIIGLLFKDRIELTFAKPIFPALFLIVTAVLLFATKLVKSPRSQLKLRSAILIGIAQAIGLLPGISRSGATIATALLLGINHAEAFEFSFLLSIPAVIGANILTMKEFTNIPLPIAIISIIITALTGLLALFILKNLVRQGKLYYFGFYCILLSVFALIIF
jgi:undecaprenyl-diphosphatase